MKRKNETAQPTTRAFLGAAGIQSVREGRRVNIIQHPGGRPQEITFRDNKLLAVRDDILQYLTDTEYGSSGSPILNDHFQLVGLHSQRVADPRKPDRWYRNQGFRLSAIVGDGGQKLARVLGSAGGSDG